MWKKYGWLVAVIAAVLFAACPIEGDVSFGEEEEFTITYSANGGTGSVPAPQSAEAGAHIVLPNGDGLSRTGYAFGGWCANAAGTGTKFAVGSAYTMPNGNITLYAFWNNNTQTHTVTFNVNGGTGTAPASQTIQAGSSITLPGAGGMSRSGFTFGGWSANAGGIGTTFNAGDSYTVSGNTTLYARWNEAAATYTVAFNANGGTGTAPASQTAQAGSSITLPGAGGLSRNGHTFGGWNTNSIGTGTNYNVGDSYPVNANVTLYAKWNAAGTNPPPATSYTVSFNANGGSGSAPASQTAQAGSSITLPGAGGMSRSNFTFGGWNTTAAGTGTNYNAGDSYPVNGNVTLYAKWNATGTNPPPASGDGIRDNGTSVAAQLAWLKANAVSGGDYTIEVSANETLDYDYPSGRLWFGGKNVTIRLKGIGAERFIRLNTGADGIFSLSSGVTLILDTNITLQGNGDGDGSEDLIIVNENANLIMNAGSKLTGCTGSSVFIASGFFIMNGGEISGNSLAVNNQGSFTMKGGTISRNFTHSWGGGVYNSTGGVFNMEGGTISGNTAKESGGGVFIEGGVFNKTGGTIYGYTSGDSKSNSAVNGHAVFVWLNRYSSKFKNTTSGPGDNLFYNASSNVFSGAWDN